MVVQVVVVDVVVAVIMVVLEILVIMIAEMARGGGKSLKCSAVAEVGGWRWTK